MVWQRVPSAPGVMAAQPLPLFWGSIARAPTLFVIVESHRSDPQQPVATSASLEVADISISATPSVMGQDVRSLLKNKRLQQQKKQQR